MNLTSLDARRKALTTKGKIALAAVALLVSPVIFMVVKGLVGLAAAAVVGGAIISFAPVVAMKFANWKLKAMKSEARENPIETRQALGLAARERIRQGEQELTTFSTEVKNFTDEVKELRLAQPEDAADFDEQLANLKRLLQHKVESLREAVAKADAFDAATARAARKWKVAQSAIRMQRLTGEQANDALDKILAEESLDSVQTAMNRAMAELDTALAMAAPPALSHNPSPVIDVHAVEVRERIRA
jgi:hypothetical protein